MVGDIEEPSGLDFKVNSGSISFGRFESESLCWERRSSFSHNRYLEEVEKYSRPGSVTEKKAYFEAHFKKKGILSLLSPGIGNQAYGENEDDSRTNDDEHSPSTDGSWVDDSEKVKNLSECGGAEEVFEPKIQVSCNDSDRSGCVRSDGGDQGSEEIKENLDCGTSNLECELPHSNESNNETRTSNDCPEDPREKSRKEKVLLGDESVRKPASGVRVNPSKGRTDISGEVSKTSGKKLSRAVNDVRSKKTSADVGPVKARTPSTKVHAIKRVENEQRSRAVKPHTSEQRESSGKVLQSSAKRQENSKIVSRKINEHAGIPKKEKAEGELKQSRKGLDFKARPLPSFYRRASHESDTSKDAAGSAKLQVQRCNDKKSSSSNGIRVSENSRSNARQGKAPNGAN